MKLKNITNHLCRVTNRRTNWESLVGPGKTIEIEKPLITKGFWHSFKDITKKVIEETKESEKIDTYTETKGDKITNDNY